LLLKYLHIFKQKSYSYLSASIGSRFDAFCAGYQPKRTPIPALTTKASNIDSGERTNNEWAKREMIYDNTTPKIMPITPPTNVKIIDSVRNCVIMVFLFAPSALRSPISRVLSVTVTS